MIILKRFRKYYLPPGTGLLKDPRSQEEKDKDWHAKEIVPTLTAPFPWQEKSPDQWRKFPIFNQDGSGSCVAQTICKILGIENFLEEGKFVEYSRRDIYSQRSNLPGQGMYTQEAVNLGYEKGITLEQLMPSENLGEEAMNNGADRKSIDQEIALVGKGGNYLALQLSDMDQVASIVATGKAVTLGVNLQAGDFVTGEVKTTPNGPAGHLIAIVDVALWKGRRAYIFDNSWGVGWGFNGQGVLTEDNLQGIHDLGYYYQALKNTWRDTGNVVSKPTYTFEKDLGYGMKNADVIALQNCLKYDECFPQDTVSTGYYGNITAKAVLEFQTKHQVDAQEVLASLAGKRVGPKTREVLNQIFGK